MDAGPVSHLQRSRDLKGDQHELVNGRHPRVRGSMDLVARSLSQVQMTATLLVAVPHVKRSEYESFSNSVQPVSNAVRQKLAEFGRFRVSDFTAARH